MWHRPSLIGAIAYAVVVTCVLIWSYSANDFFFGIITMPTMLLAKALRRDPFAEGVDWGLGRGHHVFALRGITA
jgi:hypothetical protein